MFCCMQADETQSFIFTVVGRLQEQDTTLSKIQSCVICFGKHQLFLSLLLTTDIF